MWIEEERNDFTTTSLDEAYLDITKFCKERDLSGGEVTKELRENVYKATGLTCSAGVAPNRLLAKVFSDKNKPNRQFVLPNDCIAIMTFISSLPIRKQKNSLLFARFSPSSASAGLRMSRFNEDKGGSGVSDPTQRTLLNFIKSGDDNRESVDNEQSDSDTCFDHFSKKKIYRNIKL
uniref:UmuC domain-containing protein n=1 Tax=Lactuca sativa TaxID=4236 RepID=A0A9R1XP70_LACSA|nr:hypothetical protein LSAT_V11C200076850 [Lactuca sativa]